MRGDVFLFFGIIIFLFIVWVATGGPTRPFSFDGPFTTPTASGISTTTSGFHLSGWGGSNSGSVGGDLAKAQQGVVDLEQNIVSAERFGTPSVYQGLVSIRHSVSPFKSDDPDKEYLTIAVSSRAPEAGIAITGWRVYSQAENKSFTIPDGVNLPHTGKVNDEEPIVLAPGQTAIITVGDSPVGMSFRENMCTGYFDQFQDFSPPVSHMCPTPISDFDRFYLGDPKKLDACRAYITTVPRCTVPFDSPDGLGSDCNAFIDDYLNYNSCTSVHLGDHGFWGSQWRVYAGRNNDFFTKDHDTVKLLDNAGNTVDLLSY